MSIFHYINECADGYILASQEFNCIHHGCVDRCCFAPLCAYKRLATVTEYFCVMYAVIEYDSFSLWYDTYFLR